MFIAVVAFVGAILAVFRYAEDFSLGQIIQALVAFVATSIMALFYFYRDFKTFRQYHLSRDQAKRFRKQFEGVFGGIVSYRDVHAVARGAAVREADLPAGDTIPAPVATKTFDDGRRLVATASEGEVRVVLHAA